MMQPSQAPDRRHMQPGEQEGERCRQGRDPVGRIGVDERDRQSGGRDRHWVRGAESRGRAGQGPEPKGGAEAECRECP